MPDFSDDPLSFLEIRDLQSQVGRIFDDYASASVAAVDKVIGTEPKGLGVLQYFSMGYAIATVITLTACWYILN